MNGIVYSETVVWSPPPELANLAPYQLVMVDLENGTRVMGRMLGQTRAAVGDPVVLDSAEGGVHLFRSPA